jgi:hypothetical protein
VHEGLEAGGNLTREHLTADAEVSQRTLEPDGRRAHGIAWTERGDELVNAQRHASGCTG